MSSPGRVLAILDLFSRERPVWHPDEINEALGYSRPTGYRYVKELVSAGMLQKVSAGGYALGGRIIELDYQLRQTDPVLLAAAPVMRELAAGIGFDAVLTVMFAGPRVIDTHRVSVDEGLQLAYGRGRPRPVFRSAAPKILLAHLARGPMLKVYEAHAEEIAGNGMGASWAEFRSGLAEIRKAGYYRSAGELEPGIGSLAVPVFNAEDECVGALAVVGSMDRIGPLPDAGLLAPLQEAARAIRARLGMPGQQAQSVPAPRARGRAAPQDVPAGARPRRRAAS